MPWLYNEDAALKYKLQGLKVFDGNAPEGRPVPVRYRLPEDELANLTYPIIIIEHADNSYASERAHTGYGQIPYAPEGQDIWWNPDTSPLTIDPAQSPYYSFFPTPFNLDYQVTLFGRFMTQHIQPLTATLVTEPYLPYQYGYLDVPQDGTSRTMLVEAGPTPGYGKDEDNKRLLTMRWRVRVFSEVIPAIASYTLVNAINIDLGVYRDTIPIDLSTPAELEKHIGINGTRMPSQFNAQQEP